MDELRHRYGFGYVERRQRVREPSSAAAYLSAYFVSGKKNKATLEESVTSPSMPKSIIHVSVELTRVSGVTMRSLRLRRYVWVLPRLICEEMSKKSGKHMELVERYVELTDSTL